MRFTPHTWRYLLPLQFLPAALIALALLHASGSIVATQAVAQAVPTALVDGA